MAEPKELEAKEMKELGFTDYKLVEFQTQD